MAFGDVRLGCRSDRLGDFLCIFHIRRITRFAAVAVDVETIAHGDADRPEAIKDVLKITYKLIEFHTDPL